MKLNIAQIKDIILNNPNKALIAKAQQESKRLRMHINGEGFKDQLTMVKGHEDETLLEIRRTYGMSNVPLFSRWFRPIDKVFSARGGSIYYNLPSDALNKQAMVLSMNARGGVSVRDWVRTKWLAHAKDDPNGLIFMEIGDPVDNTVTPYPTYKSIGCIYDYKLTGTYVEYVVFNTTKAERERAGYKAEDIIFRVIDDAFDYWIKRDGDNVIILNSQTFPNYFGKVPAVLNSEFESPEVDGLMLSLANDVVEIADRFLQTGSISNLAEIRTAYPKYWEHVSDCNKCEGTGVIGGEDCSTCKGTGKSMMSLPGQAKALKMPTDKGDPIVAPNIAGFVPYPKDFFESAAVKLQTLEAVGFATLWGGENMVKTQGVNASSGDVKGTATEAMLDLQPMQDRLAMISASAEKVHKFIIDHMIIIAIDSSYGGSSINYGRRYSMESPDVIWERYENARTKGASISILDDLLMEFIETKYSGDPLSMNIQLKLLNVEPFVHFTVQQVQTMTAAPDDYNMKLYFSEWLATLNDAMLLSFSVETLREQLKTYVSAKNIPLPEPKVNPVLN